MTILVELPGARVRAAWWRVWLAWLRPPQIACWCTICGQYIGMALEHKPPKFCKTCSERNREREHLADHDHQATRRRT